MMLRIRTLSVALALAACGGRAPSTATATTKAGATAPARIQLYTLDCGRGSTTKAGVLADDGAYDGQSFEFVAPCFLIRHPAGDLLWETGLSMSIADKPGHSETAGSQTYVVEKKLTDQLEQLGLAVTDVELVSISHSHPDHSGNAGLFAASTWIVDPKERADMFSPEARAENDLFHTYAALESSRTRLIEGGADLDVFGDGSVTIVPTPGHTPGHTSLLLRLPTSGAILLTGDVYHRTESREHRRVPRFNFDRAQSLASMEKLERIAKAENARVVIEHAPADIAALPAVPGYLD